MLRKAFLTFFDFTSACLLAAVMVLTVIAVFKRYVMSSPLQWIEEVNGILFLWAIMLGCASAKGRNLHLTINILTSHVGPRVRRYLLMMIESITLLVMGFLSVYGIQLANQVKFKITNILNISYTYYDYAIPVGALGVALFSLFNLYDLIRNDDRNREVAS